MPRTRSGATTQNELAPTTLRRRSTARRLEYDAEQKEQKEEKENLVYDSEENTTEDGETSSEESEANEETTPGRRRKRQRTNRTMAEAITKRLEEMQDSGAMSLIWKQARENGKKLNVLATRKPTPPIQTILRAAEKKRIGNDFTFRTVVIALQELEDDSTLKEILAKDNNYYTDALSQDYDNEESLQEIWRSFCKEVMQEKHGINWAVSIQAAQIKAVKQSRHQTVEEYYEAFKEVRRNYDWSRRLMGFEPIQESDAAQRFMSGLVEGIRSRTLAQTMIKGLDDGTGDSRGLTVQYAFNVANAMNFTEASSSGKEDRSVAHREKPRYADSNAVEREPRRQREEQREICRDFQKGRCNFGDQCRRLHEKRAARPCIDWQRGRCRFGSSCRFEHGRRHGASPRTEREQCRNFARGMCRRENCPYSHDSRERRNNREIGTCFAYQDGNCLRGEGCRYLHVDNNQRRGPSDQHRRREEPRRSNNGDSSSNQERNARDSQRLN